MHRDRWRHRSWREHGGAGRDANLIFVFAPNVYVGPPPGRGTFWFQIFLVASLNRPGGNATGVNFFTIELMAKCMQLLRELVLPAAKRVAVLVNPTDRSNETTLRDVEAAAIGQEVVALDVASGRETQPSRAWSAKQSRSG
jgi:hypothetical protein